MNNHHKIISLYGALSPNVWAGGGGFFPQKSLSSGDKLFCANLWGGQSICSSNQLTGFYHSVKYRNFNLISWCGNFVEMHSFRRVSGDSPETLRKLYLSTKFPHQEIRLNCSILCRAFD